jgi:N utilization substance protein A
VEDALTTVPGVTAKMLVKFGENNIKTVEDLADLATDDLVGWTERKDGEPVRHAGAFDPSEISREDAERLIMQARVVAGWIMQEDLDKANAAPAEDVAEDQPA